MKIVFLIPSVFTYGDTAIFEIADAFFKKGHESRIVSMDEPKPVKNYPLKTDVNYLPESHKLLEEANIIIAFSPPCIFYLSDLETKAKKYAIIFDDYKKFNIENDPAKNNYIEAMYQLDMNFMTTNPTLFSKISQIKEIRKNSISIFRPAINSEIFFPDQTFPKNGIRILVEGNMSPWKGVKEINEVLTELHGYELWTISDTPHTIKSDKHWVSPPADLLRKIISSCDILIKNYSEDGLPELQAQAMACGTVVLTRKPENMNDLAIFYKQGENCMLFSDKSEMIQYLKELINNKELRNKLIAGGLETFNGYSWDNVVSPIEQTWKKD